MWCYILPHCCKLVNFQSNGNLHRSSDPNLQTNLSPRANFVVVPTCVERGLRKWDNIGLCEGHKLIVIRIPQILIVMNLVMLLGENKLKRKLNSAINNRQSQNIWYNRNSLLLPKCFSFTPYNYIIAHYIIQSVMNLYHGNRR